jgi:gliding motility-associated lipoprotein GldH
MKSNIFTYSIIFILLFSCEKENIHYHSFPDSSWSSQDDIKFDITTEDSTQVRISNISIRHNTSYKYQNIICFLHHSFKENLISTDTINFYLAEDDGKWIGVGKSNIKEFTTTILTPKTYQNGIQSFSLELAMRDNTSNEIEKLNNISDISFYLSSADE